MFQDLMELIHGEIRTAITFVIGLTILGYAASSSVVENTGFLRELMNQLIGIYGILGVGTLIAIFLIVHNRLQNF